MRNIKLYKMLMDGSFRVLEDVDSSMTLIVFFSYTYTYIVRYKQEKLTILCEL